jgi:hypothetical protein
MMVVKPGDRFAISGYDDDMYELVEVVGYDSGYGLWRVEYLTGNAIGVSIEVTESTLEPVDRYDLQRNWLKPK